MHGGGGVGLVFLLVAGAGCFGDGSRTDTGDARVRVPPDFRHLSAPGAQALDAVDTRSFVWDAVTGPGGGSSVLGLVADDELPGSDEQRFEFEVDESVGYVNASLVHNGPNLRLRLLVLDDQGAVACGLMVQAPGDSCTAMGPAGSDGTRMFRVAVTVMGESQAGVPSEWLVPDLHAGGLPYRINVTLHPAAHIPWGDVEPALDARFQFLNADTGREGGEPTLGLTSDGSIFVVEFTRTLRSDDDGSTWRDVTAPLTTTTLDPMLYVDPWTDRVFVAHLYVGCSYLSWSDDKGGNWITNPAACGTPGNDHQKLAVGSHLLPSPVYAGIVYYSYASFGEGIWVSRSLDGGVTWTSAPAMSEAFGFEYRTGGPIAADRGGNVYVPAYLDGGGFAVAVSNDHGATFRAVRAGDRSAGLEGIDPGLALDAQGNAYGAYWGDGAVRVVVSTDHGDSWSPPRPVSPPALTSFVLADAVAGDRGRVAVAYLATADTPRGPNHADAWARWHLYLSYTDDALDPEPVWNTTRVTPADDPVQIGSICTGGIGCFGGNRNLLDFIDVQAGPDGRIYAAYTDGCREGCTTPQTSRDGRGFVAVQAEGPRLFADGAPWAR